MRAASLNDLAVSSVQQSGLVDVSGAQSGNVTVLADKGNIKVDGTIKANSTVAPKGGNIVMGHDLATGVLAAKGDYSGAKLEAGKGFVETSGDWIATTGTLVKAGEWLLDPANLTISAGPISGTAYVPTYEAGADSVILATDIANSLNAGTSVTISTGTTTANGSSDGNINVTSAIVKSGMNSAKLTLNANNSITVGARIGKVAADTTSSGVLDIEMTALGLAPNTLNSRGIILRNVLDANGGVVILTGTSYNTAGNAYPNSWSNNNNQNSGVVFYGGSGINAATYTVKGEVKAASSMGTGGVAFINDAGKLTQFIASVGESKIHGISDAIGNFGAGLVFSDSANVSINSTVGTNTATAVLSGEHKTAGSNGLRIGHFGSGNLQLTANGRVTLASQKFDGTDSGNRLTFRGGNVNVLANSVLNMLGESIDFYDFSANLDAKANTVVNLKATNNILLSKAWAGGNFNSLGQVNITSTNGGIESYRDISAAEVNLVSKSLLVNSAVNVTGKLAISTPDNKNIRLGATADQAAFLDVTQAELNRFKAAELVIGNAASTNVISTASDIQTTSVIHALTLQTAGTIDFAGKNLTVGDPLAADFKRLTLNSTITSNAKTIKSNGLELLGTAAYSLQDINSQFGTVAGNVGSADIFHTGALTVGSVGVSTGLKATGTIKLESHAGIAVTQKIESLNTGASAIYLNAGKSTAAGTATGGDIEFSGNGQVVAPTSATVRLLTGSVAGSTGLGVPVGNYRYGSDEITTSYNTTTKPIGAGTYAIYRERPVVELTLNSDNKTYDALAYTGANGYVVSTNDLVNGDTSAALSGSLIAAGDSQGAKNAGIYSIAGSGLSSDLGYALSYTAGTLTINKAILTTSLQANDKTYDGSQVGTGSIALSGLVNNEILGATASTILFDTKDVGSGKTVTASGIALDNTSVASNYQLASTGETATATASIIKRVLTLSGTSIKDKVYDATTLATVDSIGTLANTVSGETVGVIASASFDNANVGTGKVVTLSNLSLTGSGSTNYSLATPSTTTGTVTKAPLALTLTDKTTIYGTVVPLSYTLTGFVNNETEASAGVSVVGLQSSGFKSLSTTNNVGTYAINAAGISAQNYEATSVTPGTLTINPATLTLTPNAASKFILTAEPTLTFSASGFVNGDASNVLTAPSISRVAGDNPGDYVISLSGGNAQNYVLDNKTNIFTILPAFKVSILLDEVKTTYGTLGNIGASTVTSVSYYDSNLKKIVDLTNTSSNIWTDPLGGGISITPTLSGVTVNSNVGTYSNAVIAAHSGTTLSQGNFTDVMVVPSNYIIDKKILTITADSSQRIYDGSFFTSANANVSSSGFVLGQNLTTLGGVTYSGSAMNTRNVGSYDIQAMLANPANTAASNYDIRYVSGQLVTTARPITINGMTINTKEYDGTSNATANLSSVTFGNLIVGDNVNLNTPTATFDNANVGIGKVVTLENQTISGADATNYTLINNGIGPNLTYSGNITAKVLSVSGVTAQDKVYDSNFNASLNVSNATLNGVLSSDISDVSLVTTSLTGLFENKNVSTSNIVGITGYGLSGSKSDNYALTTNYRTTTTAAITPRTLNVKATPELGLVYNGTTQKQIAVVTGVQGQDQILISGLVSQRDAGNYTSSLSVSGDALGNYTPVLTDAAFNIARANATVTVNSATKTYNANTQSVSGYTTSGVFAGDTITVVGDQLSVRDAGTYLSTATASHNNYNLNVQQGSLLINPALLSVIANAGTRIVYNGQTQTQTATLQGVLGSDDIIVNGLVSERNAGNYTSSLSLSGSALSNYTPTLTDAAFNIARANATVTVNSATKTYNANTQSVSGYTTSGVFAGDTITVVGDQLSGRDAGTYLSTATASHNNYNLNVQQGSLLIEQAPLTINGVTAADKVEDGTTRANLNFSGIQYGGLLGTDDLNVTGTGLFDTPDPGSNKPVFLSLNLTGTNLGNYRIKTQSSAIASIFALEKPVKKPDSFAPVTPEPVAETVKPGTQRPALAEVFIADNISPTQRMLASLDMTRPNQIQRSSMIQDGTASMVFTLAAESTQSLDCSTTTIVLSGDLVSCGCEPTSKIKVDKDEPEICFIPSPQLAELSITR